MGVSNKSSLKQPPLFAKFLLPLCLAILGPALIDPPGAEEKHPIAAHGNHELHPALGMSLFAAEPAVVDPVAMTFDEHGRVYVVEMRDYPSGIGPDRRPGGTVRLLEDENGDGQIDKATLFAEWLSFPTSVAPWNGGILVTAPPEILFLKDTDADGKADVREVLFSGFRLGVTDSNVSGLRWGLDNRVHGVNGGNGGAISSSRKPGASVSLRDFDFSFDPVTGDFTTTYQSSGGFGLVFDDWGRSFATISTIFSIAFCPSAICNVFRACHRSRPPSAFRTTERCLASTPSPRPKLASIILNRPVISRPPAGWATSATRSIPVTCAAASWSVMSPLISCIAMFSSKTGQVLSRKGLPMNKRRSSSPAATMPFDRLAPSRARMARFI